MFTQAMNQIARERAIFARDMEYIRESVEDSSVQEEFLKYENGEYNYENGDVFTESELDEVKDIIEEIPYNRDEENEEIDRIVNSPNDQITIDEVMGIPSHSPEDMDELIDAAAEITSNPDYSEDPDEYDESFKNKMITTPGV